MQKYKSKLWSGKCLRGEMSSRGRLSLGSVSHESFRLGSVSQESVLGAVPVREVPSQKTVLQFFGVQNPCKCQCRAPFIKELKLWNQPLRSFP